MFLAHLLAPCGDGPQCSLEVDTHRPRTFHVCYESMQWLQHSAWRAATASILDAAVSIYRFLWHRARCFFGTQLIKIIRPALHHPRTVRHVLRAVVRPAIGVLDRMGKLSLDH